jgi:hypothetical protein
LLLAAPEDMDDEESKECGAAVAEVVVRCAKMLHGQTINDFLVVNVPMK